MLNHRNAPTFNTNRRTHIHHTNPGIAGVRPLKNAMISKENMAFLHEQMRPIQKKRLGDPFHVLNGSGEEGLFVHVADSKHTRKAQAMEFFGFCE